MVSSASGSESPVNMRLKNGFDAIRPAPAVESDRPNERRGNPGRGSPASPGATEIGWIVVLAKRIHMDLRILETIKFDY